MAPNSEEPQDLIEETQESAEGLTKLIAPQADPNWKFQFDYFSMLGFFIYFHIGGYFGLTKVFSTNWPSILFLIFLYLVAMVSVTMGSHRLWAHKSFKAKLPLKILLALGYCTTCQNSILWWTQIHRQHHQYSDTDADPHNATRGIFFSHMGWIFSKRHPEVAKRRRFVDVQDLRNDPVVMFEHKYHLIILAFMGFLLPSLFLYWLGNSFADAWNLNVFRLLVGLHCTWTINSFAHAWGTKPYDKNIVPRQNPTLSAVTCGEGFHNYHHTFPSDYKAGEFGNNWLNLTTFLIDLCARIGWAYDLRAVAQRAVDARATLSGDGTDMWCRKNIRIK